MEFKNKKSAKYMVCVCCGETFKDKEFTPEALMTHQESNESCKGYFELKSG